MSSLTRRGEAHLGVGPSGTTSDDETTLDLVEDSLMQLTVSVSYTRDEDIPIRMHRHTSGGGSCFMSLFHKIACVVACYRKHHHDE